MFFCSVCENVYSDIEVAMNCCMDEPVKSFFKVFVEGDLRNFDTVDEVVDYLKDVTFFEVDGESLRKDLKLLWLHGTIRLHDKVYVKRCQYVMGEKERLEEGLYALLKIAWDTDDDISADIIVELLHGEELLKHYKKLAVEGRKEFQESIDYQKSP